VKRVSLGIISAILYILFFVFYGIKSVRDFLSTIFSSLADVYQNMQVFFVYTWHNSIGHIFIYDSTGLDHPIVFGLIQVFLWTALLVVIIEIIANIVASNKRYSNIKYDDILSKEHEKLSKSDDKPELFKQNSNQGKFANNAAPYVSLDDIENDSEKSVIMDPRIKTPRPAMRIILSIIIIIILGIFLYLRMLWNFHYPSQYQLFEGLFNTTFVTNINVQMDEFFGALLARFYLIPLKNIAGLYWTWGEMNELITIFLFVAFVWTIVLVASHLVISGRRKRKISASRIDIADDENEYSSKVLSIMGNADLRTVSANISAIANITPSVLAKERNKQLQDKAKYLTDIGEYVKDAGTISPTEGYVIPHEVRQPMIPEELEEDLSGNINVGINDIATLEESSPEEEIVTFNQYSIDKEEIPEVDLENIDITNIAKVSKTKGAERQKVNVEDDIAFDEDGYAYLIQKGKPFVDELADISDVIDANDLEKSVIVSRYGTENYNTLDSLEPFELKELNYDEEVDKIRNRKRAREIFTADQLLKETLSEKPFSESNVDGMDDIKANVLKADSVETKKEPEKTYQFVSIEKPADKVKSFVDAKEVKIREKESATEEVEKVKPEIAKPEQKVVETKAVEKEANVTIAAKPSPVVQPKPVVPVKPIVVTQNHLNSKSNIPLVKPVDPIPAKRKNIRPISPVKPLEKPKDIEIEKPKKIELVPLKKVSIKPIHPVVVESTAVSKSTIKPVQVKKSNFVGSFVEAVRRGNNTGNIPKMESNRKNIKVIDIKPVNKPSREEFYAKKQAEEDKMKKEKEMRELNTIVSLDKIEERQNKPNKPRGPVEARKVGFDVFIGKKK